MKKMPGIVAAVAASLILAGCGGDVRLPANTVAACYLDVDRTLLNVKDITEMVIDKLPKDMREEAEKAYEEAIEQYKKNFRCFDVEWAVATVGMDKSSPEPAPAIVVKADLKAKNEQGATLVDMVKGLVDGQESQVAGAPALTCVLPALGRSTLAFVDDTYVIAAHDAGALEKMVRLYKDGEGATSDSFDDLTDLDGDTVARLQTADVSTLVDLFDCRKTVEEYGEKCGDKDLVKMLLDIGSVTVDVKASEDVLGSVLTLDAGSAELAKIVEGAANVYAFACRIGCAALQCCGQSVLPGLIDVPLPAGDAKYFKEFADIYREACEVERDGSVVTLGCIVDMEDVVDIVVPAAAQNFTNYRTVARSNACISNLKQIKAAVEQARMSGVENPGWADIIGNDKYIRQMPKCPQGGKYALPATEDGNPTCTVTGHELPTW